MPMLERLAELAGLQSPNVEQILGQLRECGVKARDAEAEAAVRSAIGQRGSFQDVLMELGDEPFEPETFEPLPPLSDDVWHFDFECIEDHGAYRRIIENCARIAGGETKVGHVVDHVDVFDAGVAWAEIDGDKGRLRIDFRVNHDWTDPKVFDVLNDRLAACGSSRRLANHELGQDCLIICKTPAEIAALNDLTACRFKTQF